MKEYCNSNLMYRKNFQCALQHYVPMKMVSLTVGWVRVSIVETLKSCERYEENSKMKIEKIIYVCNSKKNVTPKDFDHEPI